MARHPLDETSAALLERIDKEDARAPTTAKSHLIGGITVVGSKLDDFLRELLIAVALAARRDPADLLPQVGKRTVSLRRATAGQLLQSIGDAAEGLVLDPSVRACVEDARSRRSVLGAVVGLRNLAVHQTALPKDASATLKRLGALLRKYRREAGWDR
ncbi:MAG: hypothetical protein IT348_11005 [Candidatus Eisenbacteria bacterium]|nr:hypothetical protein [Candidatus Eisenbacteria bacterium]